MACLFCNIAEKKIPSKIIFENENILAFEDIQPVAKIHVLFIPKRHIASLSEIQSDDKILLGELLETISKFANQNKLNQEGYRVITNMGDDGGQSVHHLHFHLLAGRKLNWPPG